MKDRMESSECAGWRLRLTRPTGTEVVVGSVGPASVAPPGMLFKTPPVPSGRGLR